VQEFYIGLIQLRQNVFETNIVVVYDHIPQISLARAPFLPPRQHVLAFARARDDDRDKKEALAAQEKKNEE